MKGTTLATAVLATLLYVGPAWAGAPHDPGADRCATPVCTGSRDAGRRAQEAPLQLADTRREKERRERAAPGAATRPAPRRHEPGYRPPVRRAAPPGWVLDRRYRHDRYYPPRGHIVTRLPREHRVVRYRGTPYYLSGGIWYRPSGSRFVVVVPPVGLIVPVLPLFYTTLWVHGVPYYYADGAYYTWSAADAGYVVVEGPGASAVGERVAPQEELFIYPARGQSAQQQATDRYECHRWAAEQTRFDPTRPPADLDEQEFSRQRADYLRAMRACLEGRGYTVK